MQGAEQVPPPPPTRRALIPRSVAPRHLLERPRRRLSPARRSRPCTIRPTSETSVLAVALVLLPGATGALAVALEQVQMLSPINRVATDRCSRIVRRRRRPSRDQ